MEKYLGNSIRQNKIPTVCPNHVEIFKLNILSNIFTTNYREVNSKVTSFNGGNVSFVKKFEALAGSNTEAENLF